MSTLYFDVQCGASGDMMGSSKNTLYGLRRAC